jgi:hypothetical protein
MEKTTLFKPEDLAETPIPVVIAEAWNRVLSSKSFIAWHSVLDMLNVAYTLSLPNHPYHDNVKTLIDIAKVVIKDMMDEVLVSYE